MGHVTSCQEALHRLHTFVDRELTEDEMREVHTHLDACPPCRDHFTFQTDMKRLVHACLCRDTAPPELRARTRRLCAGHDAPASRPDQNPAGELETGL
ncbi:MAG: hypothetical protein NVSMB65_18860 [Chloroflexota bacterium]